MELNVDDIYLIDIFTNMITTNNNQIARITSSNEIILEEINSILTRSRLARRNRRRRDNLHSTVTNREINVNGADDATTNTNTNRNIIYGETPLDIMFDTPILRNTYSNIIPNIIPSTNVRTLGNRIDNLLQQLVNETTREREFRISNTFTSDFEPAHLLPTASDIENSTRLIRFSEVESPLNHQCPISLEPFTNDQFVTMLTTCNHLFNPASIESWFQRSGCCPVCRHNINQRQNQFYVMDIIFNVTDPSSNIV
jgi:hypothetical protein